MVCGIARNSVSTLTIGRRPCRADDGAPHIRSGVTRISTQLCALEIHLHRSDTRHAATRKFVMASPRSGSPEPRSGGDRIHDHETKPESAGETGSQPPGGRSAGFALALKRKIVGQEEAVQSLVEFFQVFKAGLSAPDRSSPTRLAYPSRRRNEINKYMAMIGPSGNVGSRLFCFSSSGSHFSLVIGPCAPTNLRDQDDSN